MKRLDLIRKIGQPGGVFIRHGGKHDENPTPKVCQPVPRHREIKAFLARSILRKLQD